MIRFILTVTIPVLATIVTAGINVHGQEASEPRGVADLCEYVADISLPEAYQRETYRLSARDRADPTQPPSVITERELELPQITLTAILLDAKDPSESVAILRLDTSDRIQHRVRVGDRIGEITILSIDEKAVRIQMQDFGQVRTDTLRLIR